MRLSGILNTRGIPCSISISFSFLRSNSLAFVSVSSSDLPYYWTVKVGSSGIGRTKPPEIKSSVLLGVRLTGRSQVITCEPHHLRDQWRVSRYLRKLSRFPAPCFGLTDWSLGYWRAPTVTLCCLSMNPPLSATRPDHRNDCFLSNEINSVQIWA